MYVEYGPRETTLTASQSLEKASQKGYEGCMEISSPKYRVDCFVMVAEEAGEVQPGLCDNTDEFSSGASTRVHAPAIAGGPSAVMTYSNFCRVRMAQTDAGSADICSEIEEESNAYDICRRVTGTQNEGQNSTSTSSDEI